MSESRQSASYASARAQVDTNDPLILNEIDRVAQLIDDEKAVKEFVSSETYKKIRKFLIKKSSHAISLILEGNTTTAVENLRANTELLEFLSGSESRLEDHEITMEGIIKEAQERSIELRLENQARGDYSHV